MMKKHDEKIVLYENDRARRKGVLKADTSMGARKTVEIVRQFHRTLPHYRPTPLIKLNKLAEHLGISGIRIKDESHRFGLNAFKVLGASYGLCRALSQKMEMEKEIIRFDDFADLLARDKTGRTTCVTATDGNHGRAVTWVASHLGCRSVVYMPRGSSPVRLQNIQSLGADASIIDGNYDDAVRLAAQQAKKNKWLLIQDTAMPGYENVPRWIMQGYMTMVDESLEQMEGNVPTHVFLQSGVGSYAAAIQAYLVERFADNRPVVIIVEPTNAACFLASMTSSPQTPQKIHGDMDTIMAGLACGEPSTLAWNVLRDYSDGFVACPDETAALGMRILGNPMQGDDRMVSGESGAVTLGLLHELLYHSKYRDMKTKLALGPDAEVLLFSTEGDTDPEMYRKIVWEAQI